MLVCLEIRAFNTRPCLYRHSLKVIISFLSPSVQLYIILPSQLINLVDNIFRRYEMINIFLRFFT